MIFKVILISCFGSLVLSIIHRYKCLLNIRLEQPFIRMVYLQLKEMVLALLHESDLELSDDMIETIVDKVHKS